MGDDGRSRRARRRSARRRRSGRRAARVGAERRPLPLEAHLLVDRAVARERLPVAGSTPPPARGTRAPRSARPARRGRRAGRPSARTPTREAYGEPTASGGLSGSTCHQRAPAAASQSTNAYASGPSRPPGSDVGWSWTPSDRSGARGTVYRVATCLPTGSSSATSSRRSTAAAGRRRRASATRSHVGGDDRPRRSRGRCAPSSGTAAAAGAGARRRSSRSATTASPARSASRRPAGSGSRSTRGSTGTRAGSTSTTGRSPPGRRISRASSPRARRSSARARSSEWRAAAAGARRRSDRHGAGRSARARGRGRAGARARRRLVRALPALVGRLRRRDRGRPASSPSSASTSSTSRRSTRSGARTARGGTTPSAPSRATSGSPWAIGGAEGGHDAIHPELGTEAELAALVAALREHGMELALDLALQCSPDHPWLADHPEWFQHRPDGSLKYAENPPKRYQDIHNLDWDTRRPEGALEAVRDVVLRWCGAGVTVFRVDNPHTKPVPFWEWLIAEVRASHPETVFLSEAFTRPVDDDAPREGRVLAVLHVLHVEEHEGGARRVRRAAPLVVDLPPPEPLAEHAGHPPRAPADRRPAGVREPARPRGDALADLRHLLRLRELRERPAARRGARSTSTRRSTSCASGRSTGSSCRSCGG